MDTGEGNTEINPGSTEDFAAALAWRTRDQHHQFLGALSPKGHFPDDADSLGSPVTAEVVEIVNSDSAVMDHPTEAIDPV